LAASITFHPAIRTRCVTLDGDILDPMGTMEGGAAPQQQEILGLFQKFHEVELSLESSKEEESHLRKTLSTWDQREKEFASVTEKVDLLSHEISLILSQLQQSKFHRGEEKISEIKQNLISLDKEKFELEGEVKEIEKANEFELDKEQNPTQNVEKGKISGKNSKFISKKESPCRNERRTIRKDERI